jgi:hypothetical protein
MSRRVKITLDDLLSEQVDRRVQSAKRRGEHLSLSAAIRGIMEDGLRPPPVQARDPKRYTDDPSYQEERYPFPPLEATPQERGIQFEHEICDQARALLGDAVRKVSTRPGRRCADIEGPIFSVECKAGKRPSVRQAMDQAREATPRGKHPLVVFRDDGSEPMVCLDWAVFLEMWSAVYSLLRVSKGLERGQDVER